MTDKTQIVFFCPNIFLKNFVNLRKKQVHINERLVELKIFIYPKQMRIDESEIFILN